MKQPVIKPCTESMHVEKSTSDIRNKYCKTGTMK